MQSNSKDQNVLRRTSQSGLTLVELIVSFTILSVVALVALQTVRVSIKREKERELRRDLWEMRNAIDHYKDFADQGAFQTQLGSEGYPPDLESLVNGVNYASKKIRFLRRIPVDPMTGKKDWGLHSNTDDPDSDSWGGTDVFDVYTKSDGTALDGTKYRDW